MIDSVAIAILAGLGGMLGWGLADFFAKKTVDEIGDVTTLILAHVVGTVIIIGIFAAEFARRGSDGIPSSWQGWFGLVAFGALQAAVYLFVYRGFGKGQVAVLAPLFASFAGLVALLSVIAFGEPVSVMLVVALSITFAGVIALNLDPDALRKRRLNLLRVPGFNEIAIATVLATIWTLGWDRFVAGQDWLAFAAAMYLFMTVVLLAYGGIRRTPLRVGRGYVWLFLALIGGCEVGAYIAVSWGYEATPHTSVVALVSGAFALPTVLLARIFLNERTGRLRAFGSIMIIAGIVLLGVR